MSTNNPIQDYQKLIDILNTANGETSKGEVYQELMNTEKKVLKHASRISTQRFFQDNVADMVSNIKIFQFIEMFTKTWYEIYVAFMNKNFSLALFLKDDRKIYVGVMIILIAILFQVFV